jgi:hypothetical protein
MIGQGLWWGVTVSVPVAPRCTPLVTAASGTDLTRPVAGGLALLHTCSLHTRCLCVGSPVPSVSRRRTIPETVEKTEIQWVGVNADRPYIRWRRSVDECRFR